MPEAVRSMERLNIILAQAPIAWPSTERGYGENEDFLLVRQIHDGELELLRKDSASSVEVWRPKIGELCRAICCRLDCLVEALTEPGADRGVVADFVYQFETRLVVETNSSHFR